jgi:hypothetical protein
VSPKLILTAGLIALIPACAARAQSDTPRSPTSSEAATSVRPYIIRVDSTMGLSVQIMAGVGTEEQLKLIEATRIMLYQAADGECVKLKRVFKAECRLQNIRINSGERSRGNGSEMMQVNASSSYELIFRPN